MHKIKLSILILFIGLTGCAVSGKLGDNSNVSSYNTKEILKSTSLKNLTATGFFIQKGRITTYSSEARIVLFFTMKYSTSGNYLISLRGRTGIEAFRVFMTKDTILVNDRLNQRLLYGNPKDFAYISGLPVELLKISVGDFFVNKPSLETAPANPGEIRLIDYFEGLSIHSSIDSRREKLKEIYINSGDGGNGISLEFSKYRDDSYNVPRKIEINDAYRKIKFVIQIDKYIAPWVGEFEFIPGKNYNRTPLR